jgi:hypothetical protein
MADPQPSAQVNPEEQISRYLLRPKLFNIQDKIVYAQAFNPPKVTHERPVRQISVYRTEGCQEQEIWEIGDEYVTKLHRQQFPVLARADLTSKHILNSRLQIVPHPYPHPRHADIEGWPNNNDEENEVILVYLASVATLIPRPSAQP